MPPWEWPRPLPWPLPARHLLVPWLTCYGKQGQGPAEGTALNQGRARSGPSQPTPNASFAPLTESSQVTGERKMTTMQELVKGKLARSRGWETDNG